MHNWILQHDDRWSFIALYVTLAVVLSMFISLFWLVVLVAVHFCFELVRQGSLGARGASRVVSAGWEVKLDAALVLFALALTLYMDVVLGLLGLQAAARAGAAASASMRAGGRVLAWERTIRGVLLSADDAAQVARVALRRGAQHDATPIDVTAARPAAGGSSAGSGGVEMAVPAPVAARASRPAPAAWRGRWGAGDRVAIGIGALCTLMIAVAPSVTGGTYGDAAAVLRAELHPLPQRGGALSQGDAVQLPD